MFKRERNAGSSESPGAIEDATQIAIVRSLLLTFNTLLIVILLISLAREQYERAMIAAAGAAVYAALLLAIPRLGAVMVGYLTLTWYLIIGTAALLVGRGIHDVAIVLFPAAAFVGAVLLRRRHVIPFGAVVTGIVMAVGIRDVITKNPAANSTAADVVVVSLLMTVSTVLSWIIARSIRNMIRETHLARERLEHLAFHDSLTELPNRWSLHRAFDESNLEAGRIGLAMIDLDRFRATNEALGHAVGDEILVQVGARLSDGRDGGRSEVFRLGGDEFAVLLFGLRDEQEAEERGRNVQETLREPCTVGGIQIDLAASVGIAIYPDHGTTSHELLRCADVAMDRAKRNGRGVMAYRRDMDFHVPERLGLMADLSVAIRDGSLRIHYQPKVSLTDGTIVGSEALVRWAHPRLGVLSPEDFVRLAESTDVIHALTWWVFEQAVKQLSRWQQVYGTDLTMAVNLSPRNLLAPDCSERLDGIVRSAGVAPDRVELELTETAMMTDTQASVGVLQRIASSGIGITIDDFGTGYSSLAYLQRFPLTGIKIDRSFVHGMRVGTESRAIVQSTVKLARTLGLTVVAEGIEDRDTADALHSMGCELAQGYFFAAPAPPEAVGDMLRTQAGAGEGYFKAAVVRGAQSHR